MERKIIVRRAIAFSIDWVVIFGISFAVFISGPRFSVEYLLYPSIKMFSAYGVILGCLCFIFLPLVKDCLFKSASLGKWIMKLKVVNTNDYKSPSLGKLILRNITFYLPFVELLLLLANHGNTVGDMLSKTTVIVKDK